MGIILPKETAEMLAVLTGLQKRSLRILQDVPCKALHPDGGGYFNSAAACVNVNVLLPVPAVAETGKTTIELGPSAA